MFFFLLCFLDDFIKLAFFVIKRAFFIAYLFFNNFQCFHFFSKFFIGVAILFFREFAFKLLHFLLFINRFELAAIFHSFALFFIFFYKRFCIFYGNLFLLNKFRDAVNLFLNAVFTTVQPLYFIFKIAYFHGKFTFQNFDLIQLGIDLLQSYK